MASCTITVSWLDVAKSYVRENYPGMVAKEIHPERNGDIKITITDECLHLVSEAIGGEVLGRAICRDCGKEVPLSEVFNNWLERLQNKVGS